MLLIQIYYNPKTFQVLCLSLKRFWFRSCTKISTFSWWNFIYVTHLVYGTLAPRSIKNKQKISLPWPKYARTIFKLGWCWNISLWENFKVLGNWYKMMNWFQLFKKWYFTPLKWVYVNCFVWFTLDHVMI